MTAPNSVGKDHSLPSLRSRDAVHDDRRLVGRLLTDLSEDSRFATRSYELKSLGDAVATGGPGEILWRGASLEQIFTPETTISLTPRKRRIAAWAIGALAAIVVFFPVLLTWWSFQLASTAYGQWLASPQQGQESFLQLWTTGFGDFLDPGHMLPVVAGRALLFIVLCIVLIVAERVTTWSADKADDDSYQECSARLASALNYAQLTINSRDVQDVVTGLDVIREAAEQLLEAHQQTREAAGLLREAAASLNESTVRTTTQLEASTTRTTGSMEIASAKVAAGLEASTASLLGQFEAGISQLVNSLQSAMEGASASLLGSVGGVSQALERSVTHASGTLESSVTTAVGALNASVGQVADASQGMQEAVGASASAQQMLAEAAAVLASNTMNLESSLREQIQQSADSISREVEKMRAEAGTMAQSTGEVGNSLGRYTAALQHQMSELTQIRAALMRLSGLDSSLHSGR